MPYAFTAVKNFMAGQDVSIVHIVAILQKGSVGKMTRRMLRREARYQVIMAVLRSFCDRVKVVEHFADIKYAYQNERISVGEGEQMRDEHLEKNNRKKNNKMKEVKNQN